jgi:hypothetical protein
VCVRTGLAVPAIDSARNRAADRDLSSIYRDEFGCCHPLRNPAAVSILSIMLGTAKAGKNQEKSDEQRRY